MDILQANRAGVSLTAGLTSSRSALPVDRQGRTGAFVRVASMANAHVHTGPSNVVATGDDLLVTAGGVVNLDVSGATHIAVIQEGLTGGAVNVFSYE